MRLPLFGFLLIATAAHAAAPDLEHDWPWWRGPHLNGIAASGQTPPTEFSETQSVAWKIAVPGRGHSSPVIVGENIFLATADEQRQIVGVICFDRETGKQKWITPVHTGNFPPEIHKKNTHASGTVASDGERIYTNFYVNGKIMVSVLSMGGKVLWSKAAGDFRPKKYKFGYGASPLLHDGNVIVAGEYDGDGFIAAFDGKQDAQPGGSNVGATSAFPPRLSVMWADAINSS